MPIDPPPDYEAFKAEVASWNQEDDLGVYEVWWLANSRYPELALSGRLAVAESVVRDLVDEGRVVLVQGGGSGPADEREPVSDSQLVLHEWATWVLGDDRPVVWMASSD